MKRLFLAAALAATALAVVGFAGSSNASQQKTIKVTMWHGQVDTAGKAMDKLAARFNKTHPGIEVVSQQGGSTDEMVTKLQTALEGGVYPDIVYIYGSDLPNVAQAEQVVDLSKQIKKTGFNWKGLYPAGRITSTIDGTIVGFPAVIDNLAVVYNRKLFRAKHIPFPKASWTWDDFRATAKKLTDANKGIYGTGWPGAGLEDTVWRFWPLLWQQGGDALDPSNKKAAFNSPEGVKALTLIQTMARKDKSLYVDPSTDSSKMYGLLKSNKIGMLMTGPWELPELVDKSVNLDYGVQLLPSYDGSHETISGPDVYVALSHKDDARLQATVDFLAWLHEPQQDLEWALGSGNMPLSPATSKLPGFARYTKLLPGVGLFVKNLANAKHIRPPVPQYTELSLDLGKAMASVMIGKSEPKAALDDAAKKVDSLLK